MSAATGAVRASAQLHRALQASARPSLRALPRGAASSLRQLSSSSSSSCAGRRRPPHARRHYERRAVPFSAAELYAVVADVDAYADFVPWCTQSVVTRRVDEAHLIADLSVGFRLLSDTYTSVVTLDPRRSVSVDVPDSALFEYLITDWSFKERRDGTDLDFYVEFAFRNPLYQRVTDLFFEEVVKKMVGAFEQRCHLKYRLGDTANPRVLHRW